MITTYLKKRKKLIIEYISSMWVHTQLERLALGTFVSANQREESYVKSRRAFHDPTSFKLF